MKKLHPTSDAEHCYVDNEQAMRDLLAWIAPLDRVAIDIEADSLYHYYEKVCLIQITGGGRNFVVDPLAEITLDALLGLLAGKTLLLHGADYDLRMLRNSFGFRPAGRLIDTMIAGQLLGLEKLGLSSLVEQFFGEKLGKGGQKSDWSKRPLSRAQLHYAFNDTRFLPPLADHLLAELDRLGRTEWLTQSCAAAVAATAEDRPAEPLHDWRIKGVRDLTPSQANFVRQIWQWREREAQQADRPPFKILDNENLMQLALWAEGHPHASLTRMPRLPRFGPARLHALQEAVREARRVDPSDWPSPKRPHSGRRPTVNKDSHRLREGVARLAETLGVKPFILAPQTAVEEIARQRPADLAGIQHAGGLLPWQAELLMPVVEQTLTPPAPRQHK